MNAKQKYTIVDNEKELSEILKINNRVVALFYASWCPFCVKILPQFENLAEGDSRFFLAVKDDQEKIADSFSVQVYPTLILFEQGAISRRLDGALRVGLNEKQLVDFIKE
jgi:thioredoxin 1